MFWESLVRGGCGRGEQSPVLSQVLPWTVKCPGSIDRRVCHLIVSSDPQLEGKLSEVKSVSLALGYTVNLINFIEVEM